MQPQDDAHAVLVGLLRVRGAEQRVGRAVRADGGLDDVWEEPVTGQVVVPTETVQEMKDNQKVSVEKRTMPGYVLVNMDLNEDSWQVVKGTPGVTGFVGASNEPLPLTQAEVDRLLHREVAVRAPSRAQFSIGESVKVISGPLSDFSGEISEINEDASKLKVLVSIFGRETPVEVGYDQVKKI
jgi:transcriptional antiterminator NusG